MWAERAIGLLALALICSCSLFQRSLVNPPTARIDGIDVQSISLENAVIMAHLSVTNPDPRPVNLVSCDGGFLVPPVKQPVFIFSLPANKTLNPGTTTPVDVPVSIEYARIPALDLSASNIPYVIKVSAVIKTFPGKVRVPFEIRGVLPLPRLPGFQIEKIRILDLSLAELKATCLVTVAVVNPNDFPVTLGPVSYGLLIEDRLLAKAESVKSFTIPASDTAHLTFSVETDFKGIKDAVKRIFRGNENPVRVEGTFGWGKNAAWSVPFSANRSMIMEK